MKKFMGNMGPVLEAIKAMDKEGRANLQNIAEVYVKECGGERKALQAIIVQAMVESGMKPADLSLIVKAMWTEAPRDIKAVVHLVAPMASHMKGEIKKGEAEAVIVAGGGMKEIRITIKTKDGRWPSDSELDNRGILIKQIEDKKLGFIEGTESGQGDMQIFIQSPTPEASVLGIQEIIEGLIFRGRSKVEIVEIA